MSKWTSAAEHDGPAEAWVRLLVDSVPYLINRTKAEIRYDGDHQADVEVLANSEPHRNLLADAAALVHRECGTWSSERPDSWTVSYEGKSLKMDYKGCVEHPHSKESTVKANNAKSSMSMWFRAADENPFAKKDDKSDGAEKKEDKKDDKGGDGKKPPFPPKKKDGPKDDKKDEPKKDEKKAPSAPKKDKAPEKHDAPKHDGPHDEEADIEKAEEILKNLEELKKAEGLEHEDHKSLDEAILMVKKFLGEEEHEMKPGMPPHGAPMEPKMPGAPKPMKMDIVPPGAPKMPAKPGMPPAGAPKPPMMPPHASSWVIENRRAGYKIGDRVWPIESLGNLGHVGDEPGRIVSFAEDGTLLVDWGGDEPLSTQAEDVIAVKDVGGEESLFDEAEFSADSNIAGMDVGAIPDEESAKAEAEAVLSKLSLKDMMSAEAAASPSAIVHLTTGKSGTFISTASDGRCLVSFDDKKVYVWPHEFKFKGSNGLFGE